MHWQVLRTLASTMYNDRYHVHWQVPRALASTTYIGKYHVHWQVPCVLLSTHKDTNPVCGRDTIDHWSAIQPAISAQLSIRFSEILLSLFARDGCRHSGQCKRNLNKLSTSNILYTIVVHCCIVSSKVLPFLKKSLIKWYYLDKFDACSTKVMWQFNGPILLKTRHVGFASNCHMSGQFSSVYVATVNSIKHVFSVILMTGLPAICGHPIHWELNSMLSM